MKLFQSVLVKILPFVPKPIVRLVSKRYVAGSSLDDAVKTVKKLNAEGALATMDVLGESATNRNDCLAAVNEYLNVLDTIDNEKLDCNISLKPTQLGLLIDQQLCYQNIRQIVEKAKSYKNFVRIDMEDSQCTANTIALFKKLSEFDNVGVVIQAYLRRSLDDVKYLAASKTNFRICKGIYIEPRLIAYKDPAIVNDNFSLLVEKALSAGCYVGIATHDEKIVWQGIKIIEKLQLQPHQYEFQMLLGVDEELKKIIIKGGHRLRVYVPFGVKWYAYSMRRLKENPQVAIYIIKAMFGIK